MISVFTCNHAVRYFALYMNGKTLNFNFIKKKKSNKDYYSGTLLLVQQPDKRDFYNYEN